MGLTGRTLGVIGAGRIGKELLRMARTFDLKLLAGDPYVNAVELGYVGARKVDLPTLLRESDFVVTIPLLNEETRHLIGAREFAQMKPTAYFINVSRGPVVDEPRAHRRARGPAHRRRRARRVRAGARRIPPIRCSRWTTSSSRRTRCAGPTNASTTWRSRASPASSMRCPGACRSSSSIARCSSIRG